MHIVILEPLGIPHDHVTSLFKTLRIEGHELTIYDNRVEDSETLLTRSREADILVIANLPLSADVIDKCPHLKMLSVAFTGVDHVDIQKCSERGIVVCNAAGYSTDSVAELAVGMMIALLRKLVPCDDVTRKGLTRAGMIGNDLRSKTVGIIGTGTIGLRVAGLVRAFDCKTLAYSRTKKKEAENLGITYVELEELLSRSDIVTLHVPLDNNTRGMINREKIALMKPSSFLINTARGPVVDNTYLVEALHQGKIAGAAIDVFEIEPPIPSDHPLLGAPNVVVTPHIGFATHEALQRRAEIVIKNIQMWIKGAPQNKIV